MSEVKFGFVDPRYEDFPPVVQVALVSGVCPSSCMYCPMGKKNMGELQAALAEELEVRFFDRKLFEKIAREVAQHPWCVLRIHGRGEPLVHPEFIAMAAFAKAAGVGSLTSFTNGILLKRHVRELLDTGIDLLEISADAADETLYRRWRRNPHFWDVVDGVRELRETRNARPGCRTKIVVSGVGHPEFHPHQQDFMAFWGRYADKVIVRPFHTYGGRIDDPYKEQRTNKYIPCVQLWERFSISPTGLVDYCYNDWGDRETCGDMNQPDATIAGLWRCSAYEAIRAASLNGPCISCCFTCSGPSLSSWGKAGYQHWVHELVEYNDSHLAEDTR